MSRSGASEIDGLLRPHVLVTGGAGYVGSHTCKALHTAGYLPVTYDDLSGGHVGAVRWGPLEVGDVADRQRVERVLARYEPVAVLHLAASASVAESVRHPGASYRNNVVGSLRLLDALVEGAGVPVVFASTCAVYGDPTTVPVKEAAVPAPLSPYGATKLVVEQALDAYGRAYGLRSVVLRLFNVAGADPDGELGELHAPEPHLIPRTLAAIDGPDDIDVFGAGLATPDGTCVRDYVHVSDVAAAHVLAVEHLRRGGASTALNVGSGSGASVIEVLAMVEEVTGTGLGRRERPARREDPAMVVADARLAREVLGWSPRRSDLRTIVTDARVWHRQVAAPPSMPSDGDAAGRERAGRERTPTVTVVIPTRDRLPLLAQTLRSVLDQRVDLEVIVVDEGSQDGTTDFLERLADPRVRHIRHEEAHGLAAARNAGAAAATGRWVAFVDDDDLWMPDKLERQVRAGEQADAAWAYGGALTFSAGPVLRRLDVPRPWLSEHEVLPARNVVPGGGSNVIVRREVLAEVGDFDPSIPIVADWDMSIRLAQVGRPALVSHPVVAYRLHLDNMSNGVHEVLAGARVLEERYASLRGQLPFDWAVLHAWLWKRSMQAGDRASARWCAWQSTRRRHPAALQQLFRATIPASPREPDPQRRQTATTWLDRLRPREIVPWPDGAESWLTAMLEVGPEGLVAGGRPVRGLLVPGGS